MESFALGTMIVQSLVLSRSLRVLRWRGVPGLGNCQCRLFSDQPSLEGQFRMMEKSSFYLFFKTLVKRKKDEKVQ